MPNADEIAICLKDKNAELSDACRTALEVKKLRNAADSLEVPKRTEK